MNRRYIFAGLVVILVTVGVGGGLTLLNVDTTPPEDPDPPTGNEFDYPVNETRLNEFYNNIRSGGPPPDGIPPIENPVYISVEDADEYLENSDIVFGLVHNGEVLAFPQRILVWHEIVNDLVGGERISITYCPLTGSSIAYKGELGVTNTTFGTSGSLINSNLLMYDRNSSSYWPQIHSQAVSGELKGHRLERIHMLWTTWARWMTEYPDSLVLSIDTGYVRNYYRDPYGSYQDKDSYYFNENTIFPVMNYDDRLTRKDVVIGIDVYDAQYAVDKSYVRQEKVVNLDVGSEKVVLFYDAELDAVRAFSRTINGQNYTFSYDNGSFIDDETSRIWNKEGVSGLSTLSVVDNFDVMWFAWVAFYPNTGLLCLDCTE